MFYQKIDYFSQFSNQDTNFSIFESVAQLKVRINIMLLF